MGDRHYPTFRAAVNRAAQLEDRGYDRLTADERDELNTLLGTGDALVVAAEQEESR